MTQTVNLSQDWILFIFLSYPNFLEMARAQCGDITASGRPVCGSPSVISAASRSLGSLMTIITMY